MNHAVKLNAVKTATIKAALIKRFICILPRPKIIRAPTIAKALGMRLEILVGNKRCAIPNRHYSIIPIFQL